MGKTKYQQAWQVEFPWLRRVKSDPYSAYCAVCLKSFKIDNQGVAQVKSHAKCHETNNKKKEALKSFLTQRTFKADDGTLEPTKNTCILSPIEEVTRAEILDALYVVRANHSFASVNGNSDRYRIMFGEDHPIASGYRMCETKVSYVIKFGIAPYVRRKLIQDLADTPFTFLFDETTTSQVKKQYDGYVIYWSKKDNKVVHKYCGSLFVGHCDADALVNHYLEFVKALGLDSSMLLHFGMDGPNTNLSFEKKLEKYLEEMNTTFLKIGTCSLHPVHTAFSKGVKKLFQCTFKDMSSSDKEKTGTFNIDDLFQDLHFFFKRSGARREDYASLESITGVTAEYMKKHAETRWVSMKYVALRCLEQWKNLKEYFLTFLPKQKNFKREVEKTQRYQRIKAALSDEITEAYVSFVAFVAHDFQEFLVPFQSTEPMIHLLYPSLCTLMNTLQRKFIKKSKMSDDIKENVYIKVSEEKNIKSLNHIDVGTRAKILLSNNAIMASSKEEKFRRDCRNFFVTAVQYLQSNLPYDVSLLQHAQYIHPEKRTSPGSLNAISNLAIKITSVLNNNCLDKVFGVKGATKESLVDQIRDQWQLFQNEQIQNEWYKFEEEANVSAEKRIDSYWKRAEQMCGIEPAPFKHVMKRIDEFWAKIDSLVDEKGSKKYAQLVALVKCVVSLSHGNSTPERGFSINKLILEVHGYSTYEDTLTALRLVKDELLRVGGESKFSITKELLSEVKMSYSRYESDRAARKAANEAEHKRKKELEAVAAAEENKNKELENIEDGISDAKAGLSVANDLILQAHSDLDKALQKKGNNLQRNLLESANSKLKIGTDRKRKFQDDLDNLEKRRKKMLSSKK